MADIQTSKTLGARQLTGRMGSFQQNLLFQRQLHSALKASQTPLNSWSGGIGRFEHHIKVLSGTLKFMETLQGDELYAYVNKVFASKPELREAIEKLNEKLRAVRRLEIQKHLKYQGV